tara:strand:- start:917 stop:1249 length:333 start_codon:yes stop_codon:yes gene_type:complete
MNFYKNVIEHRGKLLVRGIHEGKEFKEKIDYSPTLYAMTQEQTNHKTLNGQYLKPITFKSISKAREFKKNYNLDNDQSLVWIDTNINIFLIVILMICNFLKTISKYSHLI